MLTHLPDSEVLSQMQIKSSKNSHVNHKLSWASHKLRNLTKLLLECWIIIIIIIIIIIVRD